MSQYKNPEKYKEVMEQIKLCPTLKEITLLLNSVFPTWIIGGYERFSEDYKDFQDNWIETCKKSGVKPTAILNVGNYLEDEEHTLIRTFCEVYTASGFHVRKDAELYPCRVCGLALLSKEMYEYSNLESPKEWSDKCSRC